jgi:MinD superfamily P-loop ATPase
MAMKYDIVGSAKFGGVCVKCHRQARDFECVLLSRDGKYAVAHASCAGCKITNKVSGRRAVRGPDTLEIE